jgi:hypothetical protein
MTRKWNKVKQSLRQTRDFAAGVLIGSVAVTPVFAAATDITFTDLRMPILIGSVVLLVVGVALEATQMKRRKAAETAPTPQPAAPREFSEGIGQYRLQLGRGDAD